MAEKIITLNRPNFLASEVGLRTEHTLLRKHSQLP